MLCSGTYPSRSNNGVLPPSYPGKNHVCCCFSFLYIVCVPDNTLHTSTRITGVPPPPPPPRRPRIFTTARARTTIKIVDYEHPSFSQGKAPWGRGCRFPSLRDSRASETRARVKITGTRERWDAARREKHDSLGFVCSPSFFFLSPPLLAFLALDDVYVRTRFARSTIPEGKWETTHSLQRLVRPFHSSFANVQRAFILRGRDNLILLTGFHCQIESIP